MTYYKLASSDLTLLQGGPIEAMRMAYQFNEYKLREAVKQKMKMLCKSCSEMRRTVFNNIEVPILLKTLIIQKQKHFIKKILRNQWQHMLQSIEALPQSQSLLNSAAWLGALNDHELQKMFKYVEKAIETSDPSAANYDTRAEVQYRLKMYKEALESIEKAASLDKLEPFFRDRVDMFRKAAEANK